MTLEAREWLPVSSQQTAFVRAQLDKAAAAWSEAMFAKARVRIADVRAGARGGDEWQVWGKFVGVRCPPRGADRIAEWSLGAAFDQVNFSPIDRTVVDAFTARVVRDIALRLERAFGWDGAARDEPGLTSDLFDAAGGVEASVTDDMGRQAITLAIPAATVIAAFKASLGPRARPPRPLTPFKQALAATPIAIEAILGRASLSLADFRTMAAGDVLILDTDVNGTAEMGTASDPAALRGRLLESDGHVALAL
ncbi:MAG: surface presentation of antigen protein, partial [Caulobacteraceae bacterium]|nr:surface presentation of antigen protein [Caulobacteraceae bacterium]